MKRIVAIISVLISLSSMFSVQAAEVPRESLPCNATEEQIIVTERLVGHIFDEVINGMGYSEARVKIYQSVNPSFNPDIEFAKDTCYRDIPSVDNSLFAIARKLILNSK